MLAAWIVVLGTLIAVLTGVSAVAFWSESRRLGRKPLIVVVAVAASIVVQVPLPEGPSLANVPLAFAMVVASIS